MDMLKKGLVVAGFAGVVAAVSAVAFQSTPTQCVGEWRYTTINGRSYYDGSIGQYLGHGGGNSETLVFGKDGSFKDFVYIENSPSAGWTTQITTTMEGRVEWSEGRFKLIPSKGHYKVRDNRVARQNYDRPMNADDLKRMQKNYEFSMATANGKPAMAINFGGTKVNYVKAD